ncbi:MAG: mechanosensitive ion channel domain-containing protein [Bacteroidota bacterium]
MMTITLEQILNWTPIPGLDDLTFGRLIFDFLVLVLIFGFARFAVWFVRKLLNRRLFYLRNIDEGKKYAIIQISKYFIYVLAAAIVLDKLHIGSIIFTSFAGLFVGLGFGIQQTFNDLVSGLILLFEGSVKVGDILRFEDQLGRVISIGVRHSVIQTRNDITILVPNSKLIVESVMNLSGHTHFTRFGIKVGVVYGSNVQLVKEKLVEAVVAHPDVLTNVRGFDWDADRKGVDQPLVYFRDFGDNSLVFEIFFWTANIWDVEIVSSDIRYNIDRLFRENNIVIAFPQRDVHLKLDPQVSKTLKEIRAYEGDA